MSIELNLTHRQLIVLSSIISRALEVKDLFKEEISPEELEDLAEFLDEVLNDYSFNEMDRESTEASKK